MIELSLQLLGWIPFYFLGALPTGYLVARLHGIDITKEGSGNVGATNIARTIGKKAGIFTLLIDALKGAAAVLVARLILEDAGFYSVAGLLAVCGHCFSIPGRTKGGKGVATSLGVLLALAPYSALGAVLTFVVVFFASKIVSLASISAALMAPIVAMFCGVDGAPLYSIACTALLVCFRHKENIERLCKGTEKKFAFKK